MWYDFLVIGTDPAGVDAAVTAARLGHRVGLITGHDASDADEADWRFPESEIHRIWRKAVDTAIEGGTVDSCRRLRLWQPPIVAEDVRSEFQNLCRREAAAIVDRLEHFGIDVIHAVAAFAGTRNVQLRGSAVEASVHSERIMVGTGTRSVRPPFIPFDGRRVIADDDLPKMPTIPSSATIVGDAHQTRSVIRTLKKLGVAVAWVTAESDGRSDRADSSHTIHDAVVGVEMRSGSSVVVLASGRRVHGDMVIYAGRRKGNTEHLNLMAAGIDADEHGRLWCTRHGRTWNPNVFGCGEVIGFPTKLRNLSGHACEAVCHAFGAPSDAVIPTTNVRRIDTMHHGNRPARPRQTALSPE